MWRMLSIYKRKLKIECLLNGSNNCPTFVLHVLAAKTTISSLVNY